MRYNPVNKIWIGVVACASLARAENETNTLEKIVVVGTRIEPAARPLDNADFMQPPGMPEARFRSQGNFGSQVDLSVRGMSFSSAGMAIDGAAFRNPQTEHFNLGAQLPAEWTEPPRLLTGLERFATTTGHAAGTLDYRLARMNETRGSAEVSAGNRGMFAARADGVLSSPWRDARVATGAFAGFDRADQTDGYKSNDLERWRVGARTGVYGDALDVEALSVYEWRRFGAQGFYAAPAALKSEEQLEEWLNMAALRHTDARGDVSRASLAWRRHRDVYWLDRERPEWYRNNTVSDNVVAHADTRQTLSAQWALALRADAELERIDGRYRGTLASVPMGHHLRRRAEVAAVPSYTLGDWTFSLGGGAGWHSAPDEKCYLLPAAGAAWKLAPGQTLFANYTESIRRPSYLELNYESPTSLGNQGLKHQHSRVFEAGWEGASREAKGRVTAFADETKNAVDWLLDRSSGRWVAENVPRVTTLGVATSGEVKADDATEFFAGAAWLWKRASESVYASRYALDYPAVDARLGARRRLASWLRCEVSYNFWYQARNPARGGACAAHLLDLSAVCELPRATTLRAGIWNPLGDSFETYPGQPMLGPTAHMTIRKTF